MLWAPVSIADAVVTAGSDRFRYDMILSLSHVIVYIINNNAITATTAVAVDAPFLDLMDVELNASIVVSFGVIQFNILNNIAVFTQVIVAAGVRIVMLASCC